MDYCTSCRRHLNGALVCPGCGAYAPDIAPAPIAMPAPTWEFTAAPQTPTRASDTWHDGAPPTDVSDTRVDADTSVDVEGVPFAPQGRAARRRQVARWKKNKRKAVLATAVALAGGGLTLVSMDRQGGGGRTQAATAPDTTGMGGIKDEADQYTPPSSSGSGDGSSDTGRARDTGAPQGRYPDGRPRTTLPLVERDSEASRQSANTPSSRQAQSAGQSSGDSGTGADTGAGSGSGTGSDTATDGTTTPPATDDSGSTGSDSGSGSGSGSGNSASDGTGSTGSDSGTSESGSDSSDSSSSPELCLLVICLS